MFRATARSLRGGRGAASPWKNLAAGAAAAMAATTEEGFIGPVAKGILSKISDAFECESIKLENQSHFHAGHAGNPTGAADAETHFKLTLTKVKSFEGKKLIDKHRMINEVLKEELATTVHALSLDLKRS